MFRQREIRPTGANSPDRVSFREGTGKVRRNLAVMLGVVVLLATMAAPALADDYGTAPAPPTPGVGPTTGFDVTADTYHGPSFVRHEGAKCKGDICPDHFSSFYHIHTVDAITGTYNGYYDTNLGRGCIGPCTLTATEYETYSNQWGVSIQFDKGPVSAKVGYDVTYTGGMTFSYSFPVPAGQTKVVHYQDWYHVTNMNVHTTYYSCPSSCIPFQTEYGTAWAGKWYQRIFYAANA